MVRREAGQQMSGGRERGREDGAWGSACYTLVQGHSQKIRADYDFGGPE